MSLALSSARTVAPRRLASIKSHLLPRQQAPSRTMASIPETMKGVQISRTGGVDVLEYKTDIPVPEPKEGEVLVKNDFIGVNFIDTYFRSGLYKAPHFPYILGREGAGTIVSQGPQGSKEVDASLKVDTKAVYMNQYAYAEYTAVNAEFAYALPEHISTEIGAAGLLQGLTALTLIREAHHVNKGNWVLVHAAAGGMGLWLCQLLKAVGARTIGTASTAQKRELAKKAGAEVVLEYADEMGDEAFVNKIKELTGGEGVPVVFDGVGKATFDVSLDCVARKGSMISYGNASGAVAPFSISRLAGKNARLMRPTLFNFVATREEFEKYTKELFEIVDREKIDVRIHKVYDLKDAGQAQTDLEGRKTTGKLVLKP